MFTVHGRWLAAALLIMAAAEGAAQLTVSLAPSDYNGYGISCFGLKDGAINATVSGGTPPYAYFWSNGATTEDLSAIPAGYYRLDVRDADSLTAGAQITLVEPTAMRVAAVPNSYPNGFNISCHECFNGSIEVTVTHGVAPYAYDWGDGTYTQQRTGLGAQRFRVAVTDANGCVAESETIILTQPERRDWTMVGNANTSDSLHFFGTLDEQDVVLKSNGAERLRLTSEGQVRLSGDAFAPGPVYIDADGTLRGGGFPPEIPPKPPGVPCYNLDQLTPFWETQGNDFDDLCAEDMPLLGTRSNHNLYFITGGEERMVITTSGKVGIGTAPPAGPVEGYRLYVADGIATNDVLVKLGPWPDFVFAEGYRLMPLSALRAFVKRHSHLPHVPSAKELGAKGGLPLGELAHRLTRTVEEQALYILQLEERLERLEQRLGALEASK
ncbi:MAG: hypothetical protein QY325_08770 [Flavobacteriales bacterium]|nr:MAG: hypothetical protein QY325_08770 [Flavobacteriales bacterium]